MTTLDKLIQTIFDVNADGVIGYLSRIPGDQISAIVWDGFEVEIHLRHPGEEFDEPMCQREYKTNSYTWNLFEALYQEFDAAYGEKPMKIENPIFLVDNGD